MVASDINIEDIVKKITISKDDICAEVIVNEIIQNTNFTKDNFVFSCEGQFSRTYRHDILSSKIVDFDFDTTQCIQILLSRDSIYDMLPEGVTHFPEQYEPVENTSVDQMIKGYRKQKKEEENARKFFKPFENEFFSYKLDIQNAERNYLFKLNGFRSLDFFYDFWGISHDLPEIITSKFIKLLPYAYKIIGNIDLTIKCLSYILEEKVNYENIGYEKYATKDEGISLGKSSLGIDFICGNSYLDYSLHLNINIGPLEKTSFTDYIHNGSMEKFINVFYEHFFPMEVEINTVLLLQKEEEKFNFDKNPTLGYSTRI